MIKLYVLRLLIAANVLLVCILSAMWVTPRGGFRNVHWQAPQPVKPQFSDPTTALLARESMRVGSFMATLDRPLFSPSRRPPPPAPVAPPPPEADPFANIQLQGIYAAEGGGGIFARIDGKNRSIPVGGALGGWSLKAVQERDVTFVRGEETRVMHLVPSKLAAPASSPSPPPTGAAPAGAPAGSAPPAVSQADDPVRKQEQERQEKERARLELRNSRRAAQGLPPVTK